jgi:hypothetical protein
MGRYPYPLTFVIEKPADLQEVWALVTEQRAGHERVIPIPEGVDRDQLRERPVCFQCVGLSGTASNLASNLGNL